MPIIYDKSYKNSSETNLEVSVIHKVVLSPQPMGINRIWNEILLALLSNISFLIRAAFERDFDVVEEI